MEATIASGRFFKVGTSAENGKTEFSAEVPTLKNFPDGETGCFVEIVRWGLKLRCISQFTQIIHPEDGLPASCFNLLSNFESW
jgi:hypothetical protein